MNNYLVSIIVPCYNQAALISEALDSIILQKYKKWECIIVDDGSTDNVEDVVRTYTLQDSRIKYFKKENGGVSSARNFAIKMSQGEFILPLDGDDKISDDYVELAVMAFNNNPNLKLVYCLAEYFGVRKGRWELPDYRYTDFIVKNMIFCSSMFRRKDYDIAGGYKEYMRLGLEDWDFFLSLISKDDLVLRINKVCFYYRIQNESRTTSIKDYNALYMIIYENHRDIYDEYLENPLTLVNKVRVLEKENERYKQKIIRPMMHQIRKFIIKSFR